MCADTASSGLIQIICTSLGAAIGGPAGGAIGSAIGVALAATLPAPADIAANVAAEYAKEQIDGAIRHALTKWDRQGEGRRIIGHELHVALRTALRDALFDIGGPECGLGVVSRRSPVVAQQDVNYFHMPAGVRMRREHPVLADQVCQALKAMAQALDEDYLLPVFPMPPNGEYASQEVAVMDVHAVLAAQATDELAERFYAATAAPFFVDFGAGIGLPADVVASYGFLPYLKTHLFAQVVLNLGEQIKEDTPTWRAYNRGMLEALRDALISHGAEHREILKKLDYLLQQADYSEIMQQWREGFASVLAELTRVQLHQTQGLAAVLRQLSAQHATTMASLKRIEQRVQSETQEVEVNVPARQDLLIGRKVLIASLVERLVRGENLALTGLPGVGKTALVLALVHTPELRTQYGNGVLWGSLGPRPDTMTILAQWAEELGRGIQGTDSAELRAQVVRNAIGAKQLLIVIDDGWEQKAVELLRCGGSRCVHVVTTRDRDLAVSFAGATGVVEVQPLDGEAGYELLLALAPQACRADKALARHLVQLVGALPLAVELLGKLLQTTKFSLSATAGQKGMAVLTDPRQRLELAQKRLGEVRGERSLREVILLSLEDLPEVTQAGFQALGAFAASPALFDLEAASAVMRTDSVTVLTDLIRRSLVMQVADGWFHLHQAVADVAREQLPAEAVRRHWQHYLALATADQNDYQRIEAAYDQIRYGWVNVPNRVHDMWQYINAFSTYQGRRGHTGDSLSWLQRLLTQARNSGDRLSEGQALNNLGSIYQGQWQVAEAIDCLDASLEIFRSIGDRRGELAAMTNVGLVFQAQGKYDAASIRFEAALELARGIGDPRGVADVLISLGGLHIKQGRWRDAVACVTSGLEIARTLRDRSLEGHAHALLGEVHLHQGHWPEAVEHLQTSLDIAQSLGDRFAAANAMNELGTVYRVQGKWTEALRSLEQARTILGAYGDRRAVGIVIGNLGCFYLMQGQWQDARECISQSLEIVRPFGDRFAETSLLVAFGEVHEYQGLWEEAIGYARMSLEIARSLGNQYGEAEALTSLGNLYNGHGRWSDAVDCFQSALRILRERDDRRGMGILLNNLGEAYERQGKLEEAVLHFQQALEVLREFGDPRVEGIVLGNIGSVYRQSGKWEESLACLQSSHATLRSYGDRCEEGAALRKLGELLEAQDQWEEAIAHYQSSLAIFRSLGYQQGEGETLNNLGRVYQTQGVQDEALAYWQEAITKLHPDSPAHRMLSNSLRQLNAQDSSGSDIPN
jgi:tetratricopeptide (TPR) repeat protein